MSPCSWPFVSSSLPFILVQPGDGHVVQPCDGHLVQPGDGHLVEPSDGHFVQPGDGHFVQTGDGPYLFSYLLFGVDKYYIISHSVIIEYKPKRR